MINSSYFGSQFGTHFLTSNIKMLENQVLAPLNLEVLERVKGFEPSTPTLARKPNLIGVNFLIILNYFKKIDTYNPP